METTFPVAPALFLECIDRWESEPSVVHAIASIPANAEPTFSAGSCIMLRTPRGALLRTTPAALRIIALTHRVRPLPESAVPKPPLTTDHPPAFRPLRYPPTAPHDGWLRPNSGDPAAVLVSPAFADELRTTALTLSGVQVCRASRRRQKHVTAAIPYGHTAAGDPAASGVFLVHVRGTGIDRTRKVASAPVIT